MKNLLLLPALCAASYAIGQVDSADFYLAKAQNDYNAGLFSRAAVNLDKALVFDPNSEKVLLFNAKTAREMHNSYEVLESYNQVLKFNPNSEAAISGLSDYYYTNRQYNKAADLISKCQKCSNTVKDKYFGMAYFKRSEFPSAEKYLVNYANANPGDAEANYYAAANYVEMEMYDKAAPFYDKALKSPTAKAAWAQEFAVVNYNNEKFAEAAKYFELALQKGLKTSLELDEQMGYTYIYSGQFEKGDALIKKVAERRPGNTGLLRDISNLYYQQKQYDRSLEYAQLALQKNPNDADALYQAGLSFIKKGNKDKGQALCDKAIEMKPSLGMLRKEIKM